MKSSNSNFTFQLVAVEYATQMNSFCGTEFWVWFLIYNNPTMSLNMSLIMWPFLLGHSIDMEHDKPAINAMLPKHSVCVGSLCTCYYSCAIGTSLRSIHGREAKNSAMDIDEHNENCTFFFAKIILRYLSNAVNILCLCRLFPLCCVQYQLPILFI